MPELSNAGSGSRTSRSGRSSNKLQTSAGATTKVQIQKQELPLQDSRAIMSAGVAQSNAIGNMGKAMSGFFNAIVDADSNLLQVERAENLRVASEAQRERRAVEAGEKAEALFQERKELRTAEQEAAALQAAVNIGVLNKSVSELILGFEQNILAIHDVSDGSSLAKKADEYFMANFGEGTNDELLDQQIKNAYESKILPYISAASEDRKSRLQSQLVTDMSSDLINRGTPIDASTFAGDFDRLKGINPTMRDSEISATILGMYKESAHANGKFKQFARFISEAKVIKVGDEYKTFADQYAFASAEMLQKGLEEFQAQRTIESIESSDSLINKINGLGYSLDNDAELADLVQEQIQFTNRFGDEKSTNKIINALSDKTKALGILKAEDERWFALSMGNLSSVKTTDYNQKQLNKLLSVPATNFLNPQLSDQEFAQASTAVTGILNNQNKQMGSISPKVKAAISGMLTSKNPVMMKRGSDLLRKMDETDSTMSDTILSDNENAIAMFAAIKEDRINFDLIESESDLAEALVDNEANVAVAAQTAQYYQDETGSTVSSDTDVFKAIMADGSFMGVTDDNDFRESIADYLNVSGLDEHNLHISPIGPVAKRFMATHRALSLAHQVTGVGSSDPDEIAKSVWKTMMPNLGYERTGDGQYTLVMKGTQYQVPESNEPLGVGSQMPDQNNIVNPLNPTETVNPSDAMDKAVNLISKMPVIANSSGGAGFRPRNDKSGTFVVTKNNDDTGQPEDIILGLNEDYDLGSEPSISKPVGVGRGGLGKQQVAKNVTINLTGDIVVDTNTLKGIQKDLPPSFHLIAMYPNGTKPADKASGEAKATGYKIGVYPHLIADDVPNNIYTDKEISEMSQGGHIDPRPVRNPNRKFNNGASPATYFQGSSVNSQSDAKQTTLLQEGVINKLKVDGKISPLIGLTKPLQAGFVPDSIDTNKLFETAENISWFIQDAYKGIKEHMGTTSDPEYTEQRFEMIAEAEAWRSESYWDGVKSAPNGKGYRTVGYGYNMDSVGHKDLFMKTLQVGSDYFDSVHAGDIEITEAQGRKLFDAAVGEAESVIDNRLKGVDLNHQQRLALVSMAYNSPKLIGEKLVGYLKAGLMEEAVNEILFKSNRTRMLGLYNRRYEEALTFVGANREHGMPSYLAYMATVLPAKFAAKYAASQEAIDKSKAKV